MAHGNDHITELDGTENNPIYDRNFINSSKGRKFAATRLRTALKNKSTLSTDELFILNKLTNFNYLVETLKVEEFKQEFVRHFSQPIKQSQSEADFQQKPDQANSDSSLIIEDDSSKLTKNDFAEREKLDVIRTLDKKFIEDPAFARGLLNKHPELVEQASEPRLKELATYKGIRVTVFNTLQKARPHAITILAEQNIYIKKVFEASIIKTVLDTVGFLMSIAFALGFFKNHFAQKQAQVREKFRLSASQEIEVAKPVAELSSMVKQSLSVLTTPNSKSGQIIADDSPATPAHAYVFQSPATPAHAYVPLQSNNIISPASSDSPSTPLGAYTTVAPQTNINFQSAASPFRPADRQRSFVTELSDDEIEQQDIGSPATNDSPSTPLDVYTTAYEAKNTQNSPFRSANRQQSFIKGFSDDGVAQQSDVAQKIPKLLPVKFVLSNELPSSFGQEPNVVKSLFFLPEVNKEASNIEDLSDNSTELFNERKDRNDDIEPQNGADSGPPTPR